MNISIHNISEIQIESEAHSLGSGRFCRHISVIDGEGNLFGISLFSDNKEILDTFTEVKNL